jgi:hypothetical protein
MRFDTSSLERTIQGHRKQAAINKSFLVGANFSTNKTQSGILLKNIAAIQGIVSVGAMISVGAIAIDLLSRAMPRTPYDSGELRESGAARIFLGRSPNFGYALEIGIGAADGTVKGDLSRLKATRLNKSVTFISGLIGYSRFGVYEGSYGKKEMVDVALMTHEDLLPYEARSKRIPYTARKPGTGPKYLELPFLQYKNVYENLLRNNLKETKISEIIRKISKVSSKRGRYEVNNVVITNKLSEMYGYFESAIPG